VKTASYVSTDTYERKHGERTGLETPVVHFAVNDGCSILDTVSCVLANALNTPPE